MIVMKEGMYIVYCIVYKCDSYVGGNVYCISVIVMKEGMYTV